MNYQLKNSRLAVLVSTTGAELMSLKDDKDIEYIWQGNEDTWARRSPVLFPIIGGMKEGKFLYEDKEYEISKHGFLRDMEATVDYYDTSRISLTFHSDETTLKSYPFDFEVTVVYELSRDKLVVNFLVKNCGDKKMYFALGFHPGFKVPMDSNTVFEDYYVDFGLADDMERVEITMSGFLTGKYSTFPESRLSLRRDIFEHEAIILKNTPREAVLSSEKVDKKVVMEYPDMDFTTIWTLPDERAGYVCIEPWTSLVGEDSGVADIEDVKGIVSLEEGAFYKNELSIQVIEK